MRQLILKDYRYETPARTLSPWKQWWSTPVFYMKFLSIVFRAAGVAKQGKYDDEAWVNSAYEVFDLLEQVGINLDISGMDNISREEGPCVIIGNHMSMMETLLLPTIVVPVKPATFVVKQSLLDYPVFKHVMRSRNPIAVTRTNPRQDLKTVMSEGVARLKEGLSVIVFPQTTRANVFDPAQMSTIGIKLAKKADVPVVPLALKTDAWTNGKILKDFGSLLIEKKCYFAFGEPIRVVDKGGEEQEAVNRFIQEKLESWKD